MSDKIKPYNSELLIHLSEQEQEVVSGGRSSFLQFTNINSYAESQISVGDVSISQKSAYTLTQLTLGLDFSSGGSKGRKGSSRGWSDRDLLYFVLRSLFS
ncbi:hypothetical protein HW132_11720 [Brasilonema sp. CT11]|nr:hypothetical protein [Brasilonema sp. CT11]